MKPSAVRIVTATLLLSSFLTLILPRPGIYGTGTGADTSVKGATIAPFFISNKGQIDKDVQFYVKGSQHSFFLKESGEAITRSTYKEESTETRDNSLPGVDTAHAGTVREVGFSQSFVGANKGVLPKAGERATPTLNFFIDKVQEKGVPTYNSLTYSNLYDGIDLTYRVSDEKKVKYDLIVGAGVDPGKIVMQFDGVKDLSVDENGDLVMETPAQTFTQDKPYVYQTVSGVKKEVSGEYKVNKASNTVSFSLGRYDTSLPLIIDPVLDQLGASTLYGGGSNDYIYGLTRNSSDQIYVTGATSDSSPDLPVISGGYDITHAGGSDLFVALFDGTLANLTYATYIGGTGTEQGYDIALDTNGKVIVTGYTTSGTEYPTTVSPGASTPGSSDVVVSRLSADLSSLETSASFGGGMIDISRRLYVDGSNNIYLAGYTASTNFPEVTGNYQSTYVGSSYDIFIAKLPSSMATMEATYLGGSLSDQLNVSNGGLTVDSSGYIYVGGTTLSTDFPTTTNAYDTSHNSGQDGFISKFSSDLTTLLASTYIGNSGINYVTALDTDSSGALFAAMYLDSGTLTTTSGVLQTDAGRAYIAKFTADLQTLSIATYFGGTGASNTYINRIVLDSSDIVYVAGYTLSTAFTTTGGAYDTSFNSGTDGFVSKITADLTTLSESTYIGGSGNDYAYGLALSTDEDNVFVGGSTSDSATDYPTTDGSYDTSHNGIADGFITIFGAATVGAGVPEFSTYIYLVTLLWCGYLLYRKVNLQGGL